MSKRQAVEQLIDGAICAHEAQQHAVAITLAGAAEDAMPDVDQKYMFAITRDVFTGHADPGCEPKSEKQVVRILNAERDWLKHNNSQQPSEMELGGSIIWIFRAISKFQAVYGRDAETATMQEFFAPARAFDLHNG
ncbi:hypothetical protein [Bosea sp. (in: a-proteobacteria)]|uniref:hypothetical protein n=1 Tax=Bosea sp. (in: a-proteobacteria) TaxID=1871050 RepID=UPI003B3B5EFB